MAKDYKIKEIYYTLQGEGFHVGRPAIFCRFTGCNLWSGREEDRGHAVCQYCDTDFVGISGEHGGTYSASALSLLCMSLWPTHTTSSPFIVCTGGEPLLQLDQPLIDQLKQDGFEIAIETNGTLPVPSGIDWVCMSPKANAPIILDMVDELKIVYPQKDMQPRKYLSIKTDNYFIQPMDNPDFKENVRLSVQYIKANPQWRLSLQTHKYIGLN